MPILELGANRSAIRKILRAIADALFRRARIATGQTAPERERPGGRGNARKEPSRDSTVRRRLAKGMTSLEHLDAERERSGDSRLGKATEDRIVWGELIELELQEIDEQVDRICRAAAPPRASSEPPRPGQGGPRQSRAE